MNDQPIAKMLVTSREAAKLLSISERSLWSLAASGEIRRLKINSMVRFDLRDLQAWIDRKKGGST